MSKAMFVSEIELKPGVKGKDFEKFFAEEYLPNVKALPGYQQTIHVGESGKRPGKYLMINYFESNERSRQLFAGKKNADGQWGISDEYTQWVADNPCVQQLMEFVEYETMLNEFTHYTAVS